MDIYAACCASLLVLNVVISSEVFTEHSHSLKKEKVTKLKNHRSDKVCNRSRFGKHSCPSLSCQVKAFVSFLLICAAISSCQWSLLHNRLSRPLGASLQCFLCPDPLTIWPLQNPVWSPASPPGRGTRGAGWHRQDRDHQGFGKSRCQTVCGVQLLWWSGLHRPG